MTALWRANARLFAWTVAIVILPTATGRTSEAQSSAPTVQLPQPTGHYGIGTWRTALTDTTRGEPATADTTDRRELVVQFWYPTDARHGGGGERYEPYMDTATARTWVERNHFPVGFETRVATHSRAGAPVAAGRHPTLVFSHGLSWPVLMYQSYLEELASHGYVVAAVNHTYGADMVVFPDGRRTGFAFFPDGMQADARDSVLAAKVDLWEKDLRFVTDELTRMARAGNPILAAADLDRLGVFGHSYGGSAAALVLRDDPRFVAGLAMEGLVRDSLMRPLTLDRPFMHIIGGFNRTEMAGTQYRAGPAPYYEVVVEGMWHAMFSDLILLYDELGADAAWKARHAREMTPLRGLTITREFTRAFFDRWLRGQDSPLLHPWWPPEPASRLTSPYPEADLRIDSPIPSSGAAHSWKGWEIRPPVIFRPLTSTGRSHGNSLQAGSRDSPLLLSARRSAVGGSLSEARVKRGERIVHGEKELVEKLGRNDPCPCGSGRRFQAVLHALRPL